MNKDPKTNKNIQEELEKNSGTNVSENQDESGQDEGQDEHTLYGKDQGKLDGEPTIKQKVKGNDGDVLQEPGLGNNNTQNKSLEESAITSNEIIQQAIVGDNSNQNSVRVVVKNIIGDNKDEKKYSFSQNQSNAKQEVIDPTKPLPPKSKSLPDVGIDDLSDYSQKLQEDYLVVVTCSDNKTAYSVAYSLTEKISVSNKRLFTGGLGASKKLDYAINIDNIVINSAIGKESSLILVDSYEAQTFLDSLVVEFSTAEQIKQQLRNSQRFCICIAQSKVLKSTLERKQIKSLSFPHLEVPFVESKATNENIDQQIGIYEKEDGASLHEKVDVLRKTVLM